MSHVYVRWPALYHHGSITPHFHGTTYYEHSTYEHCEQCDNVTEQLIKLLLTFFQGVADFEWQFNACIQPASTKINSHEPLIFHHYAKMNSRENKVFYSRWAPLLLLLFLLLSRYPISFWWWKWVTTLLVSTTKTAWSSISLKEDVSRGYPLNSRTACK